MYSNYRNCLQVSTRGAAQSETENFGNRSASPPVWEYLPFTGGLWLFTPCNWHSPCSVGEPFDGTGTLWGLSPRLNGSLQETHTSILPFLSVLFLTVAERIYPRLETTVEWKQPQRPGKASSQTRFKKNRQSLMGTNMATSSGRRTCWKNQLFDTPSSYLHHPNHYLPSSFQNSIPSWFASLCFFPTTVLCKVEPCKKPSKLTSRLLSFPREREYFPLGFWQLRHIHAGQWLEELRSPNAIYLALSDRVLFCKQRIRNTEIYFVIFF